MCGTAGVRRGSGARGCQPRGRGGDAGQVPSVSGDGHPSEGERPLSQAWAATGSLCRWTGQTLEGLGVTCVGMCPA